MSWSEDSGEYPVRTPRWKDGHGVVHIAGTHTYNRVLAECGWIIAAGGLPGHSWPPYEDTVEVPTCLMCIGSAVDEQVEWSAYQEVGVAVINTRAISKLSIKLTDD